MTPDRDMSGMADPGVFRQMQKLGITSRRRSIAVGATPFHVELQPQGLPIADAELPILEYTIPTYSQGLQYNYLRIVHFRSLAL